MNWLLIATTAQVILGSSAVFDRLLLKKRAIEPWVYTFWLGILGTFAVLLLPFGFQASSLSTTGLALASGVFFVAAFFFNFRALEESEVSEALPFIGALTPVFTLVLAARFIGIKLGYLDWLGFGFLIASGLVLFLTERRQRRAAVIRDTALASLLFAASVVAAKAVFAETSFITGFFWIKIGGVGAALALLLIPHIRKKIRRESIHASARNRLLYFTNRAYAAAGSVLVSGAVFLANPALVESTQNLKYAVIFALAWLIARERFRGWVLAGKIAAAVLIAIGLSWLALGEYARSLPPVTAARPIHWGVTFSDKFSRELGLDWQKNFEAVLNELKPSRVRLMAYWDEIEPQDGIFHFDDLDWQIAAAERRNTPVILAVGFKLPRWPECHAPGWAQGLAPLEREKRIQSYVTEVVKRYRGHPGIIMWQVENEPFLLFGECPRRSRGLIEQEILLVKSLDPGRPILTTDGGEFGLWSHAARLGDVFGTTMYRKAYPRFIGPIFGVIEYPISPSYFRLKEKFVRWINKTPAQQFIVVELQGEPWEPSPLAAFSPQELSASFSPEYFRDTIEYAASAGFEEYYLWGAEWWWWMKEKHGEPRYWDIARTVFNQK